MRLLVKIIYWFGVLIICALCFSFTSANGGEELQLLPQGGQEIEIGSSFLVKTLITVLILIVGYLLNLGIRTIIKRVEDNSKVEEDLEKTLSLVQEAVHNLTLEMKYQRQKNSQYEKDMAIHRRRLNKLDNQVNHNTFEIKSLKNDRR